MPSKIAFEEDNVMSSHETPKSRLAAYYFDFDLPKPKQPNKIVLEVEKGMLKHEIPKPDTFLYFSYGTNMHTTRMRLVIPAAEFVSIARLNNHGINFIRYNKFWCGPATTIVPTANAHVWGVLWRIPREDLHALDNQHEIQPLRRFYPKKVIVQTQYMGEFTCRTYEQRINPLPRAVNDPISCENWPSISHRCVMIYGAKQHDIPKYYIKQLRRLKDNDDIGCWRMNLLLNKYAKEDPCECFVPGIYPREPLKLYKSKLEQIWAEKEEQKKKQKK